MSAAGYSYHTGYRVVLSSLLPVPHRVLVLYAFAAYVAMGAVWWVVFQLHGLLFESVYSALLSWLPLFLLPFWVRLALRRWRDWLEETRFQRHIDAALSSRRVDGDPHRSAWRSPRVLFSTRRAGVWWVLVHALDSPSVDRLVDAARSYATLRRFALVDHYASVRGQYVLAFGAQFAPRLPSPAAWAFGLTDIDVPPAMHVLLAGRTGSGKSVGLRSLLRAYLRWGFAVYAVDPKRVDLVSMRPWCADYASDLDDVRALLDRVNSDIDDTYLRLSSQGLYSVPPTKLLVVDELFAISSDKEIAAKLDRILRLGRAAGWVVLGATQSPQKEYLRVRDHFGLMIVLPIDASAGASLLPLSPSEFGAYLSTYGGARGVALVYPASAVLGSYPLDVARDVGVIYFAPDPADPDSYGSLFLPLPPQSR